MEELTYTKQRIRTMKDYRRSAVCAVVATVAFLVFTAPSSADAQTPAAGAVLARATTQPQTTSATRGGVAGVEPAPTSLATARATHSPETPLFPSTDAPAIDVVLREVKTVQPFPGDYQAVVDSSSYPERIEPSIPPARRQQESSRRKLNADLQRFNGDIRRTTAELEEFGQKIMRGARVLGPREDTGENDDSKAIEARLRPGWRHGPFANFSIVF